MIEKTRGRPQRVVMIASEVESLARTGGLGDMVEALSLALADLGLDVLVVTPRYGITRMPAVANRWPDVVPARWGWGPDDVASLGVLELEARRFASGGTRRVCLLEHAGLFGRAGIYGDEYGPFGDNALRFAVMSRGALEVAARVWPGGPDVIHAHDWHATFAVLYARLVMGRAWSEVPSVLTVHNLQFQGVLDEGALDRLHLPRQAWRPEILLHEGQLNLMKGATAHANWITTVSPTYAREILRPEGGFGLDAHLRAHAHKLTGILNGIDLARWDPRTDAAITERYDESTAGRRAANKAALAAELGLEGVTGPLFGLVARLSWQKGIDLLLPFLPELTERGGAVVVVGEGDRQLEDHLRWLADTSRRRIGVRIAFDAELSRRVYAGADFFMVPSRFEPCGLTQMYAMRYGAIPIVTNVGGLHDTVEGIADADGSLSGTGFVAAQATTSALRHASERAFRFYGDAAAREKVVKRAMVGANRFGWPESARKYAAVYDRVHPQN